MQPHTEDTLRQVSLLLLQGMPHPACRWDQRLDFDYEGTSPRCIEVQLKGERRAQSKQAGGGGGGSGDVDDLVGAGQIDLQQVGWGVFMCCSAA